MNETSKTKSQPAGQLVKHLAGHGVSMVFVYSSELKIIIIRTSFVLRKQEIPRQPHFLDHPGVGLET